MCRWVEGVVIVGAGADAGATKSVLGDAGAAGDSERGSMADGRARVPEVLAPAELEGFLAWVMGPELLEPALCAPVGEDVRKFFCRYIRSNPCAIMLWCWRVGQMCLWRGFASLVGDKAGASP